MVKRLTRDALLVTVAAALGAVAATWSPGRTVQATAGVGQQLAPTQQLRPGEPDNHPPPSFRCCDDAEPVNGKGGSAISGPYEVVKDWPEMPHKDMVFQTVAGIAIDGDRIYAGTRGERKPLKMIGWGREVLDVLAEKTGPETLKDHMMVVFDRKTGKILDNWEKWNTTFTTNQRVLISPYDPKKVIWVSGAGQIFRFSLDGKDLLQTIENKDVPATPNTGVFTPEGMGWMPNGDVWVISSSRIIRFNKDGKYLTEFGSLGSGPGQFRGAHDLVVDNTKNRMYIADRQNSRIVITDLNGKFLDQWPNVVSPYSIRLTKDGRYLWVGDGWIQKMQKYDAMTGKLLVSFGTFGVVPGTFWGMHYFTTDVDGNFYLCEDYGGRIQKFRPRKDADPAQLVGQLMWGETSGKSSQ